MQIILGCRNKSMHIELEAQGEDAKGVTLADFLKT